MAKRKIINEEPKAYTINLHNEEVETMNAPFYRRAAAYIIDSFFFYFILFQVFMLVYLPMSGIPSGLDFSTMESYLLSHTVAYAKILIGMFGASVVYLFYFVLVEKEFGTTVGKYVMQLNVASTNNQELSIYQVLIRNLTKTILWPMLLIDMLGIIVTKEKQRFSDIFAGTKVIYRGELSLVYGE